MRLGEIYKFHILTNLSRKQLEWNHIVSGKGRKDSSKTLDWSLKDEFDIYVAFDYLARLLGSKTCPCPVNDTDETHQEPNANTEHIVRHGLKTQVS